MWVSITDLSVYRSSKLIASFAGYSITLISIANCTVFTTRITLYCHHHITVSPHHVSIYISHIYKILSTSIYIFLYVCMVLVCMPYLYTVFSYSPHNSYGDVRVSLTHSIRNMIPFCYSIFNTFSIICYRCDLPLEAQV